MLTVLFEAPCGMVVRFGPTNIVIFFSLCITVAFLPSYPVVLNYHLYYFASRLYF